MVSGSLLHTDSSGHDGTVAPGSVQLLSAGSGVTHAELAGPAGSTRFIQAWLTPDEPGTATSYDVVPVDLPPGELVVVASGHLPAPVRLGVAGATLRVARLAGGDTVDAARRSAAARVRRGRRTGPVLARGAA